MYGTLSHLCSFIIAKLSQAPAQAGLSWFYFCFLQPPTQPPEKVYFSSHISAGSQAPPQAGLSCILPSSAQPQLKLQLRWAEFALFPLSPTDHPPREILFLKLQQVLMVRNFV